MSDLLFACETARHRWVAAGRLRLHLLEWGMPGLPGLVFLHGGSAHAHWFDRVVPAFAGGFHVVALDQRGHGESEWPVPPAYGTEDFAADLLAVLDALGWARAAVVGHSMGGHNAMAFAAWRPERVAALAIVDSRPAVPAEHPGRVRTRPLRRHPTREAALAAFRLLPPETVAAPALLAHLAQVGIVERDGAWVYRFDPACNQHRRPVDAWPLLPRIAAPTLIVRGAGSPIMPRETADRMRALVPGASLVEIPGTYHHLVLDAPEAFARVLADFLTAAG